MLNGFDKGEPIEIRNKSAIRPWQHILDAIDAYLTIIVNLFEEKGRIGIYNVGPENDGQMSVGQIFEYLQNKFSKQDMTFEKCKRSWIFGNFNRKDKRRVFMETT